MEFFDTFDENGVFLSSQDDYDVHYKGLWHKVIRIWLYDNEGNVYLRVRKEDGKLDAINEIHMRSSESISSCFDRGMFEKLGIHFPATSLFEQASMKKIQVSKVYSDNSELRDNYFLCDYVGEFDKSTNFFIFSRDTSGLVKVNAKGVLNLLNTRTGEVVAYKVTPNVTVEEEKKFLKAEDIYENGEEDSYVKFTNVVNTITNIVEKEQKNLREQEKIAKLAKKAQEETFVSHADDNEGTDLY